MMLYFGFHCYIVVAICSLFYRRIVVVVLAAEILKRMKPFIEDGVHPQLLIRALSKASDEVCNFSVSNNTYHCVEFRYLQLLN